MDVNVILTVFVLLFRFFEVEGKAVGKKIQDIGYSPLVHTDVHQAQSSEFETDTTIKRLNSQESVSEDESSYIRNPISTQRYVNEYSNGPLDEKYRLTNHTNLELITSDFDSEDYSNSVNIHQNSEKHFIPESTSSRSYTFLKGDDVFLHHSNSTHTNQMIENSDISKSNIKINVLSTNEGNANPMGMKDSSVFRVHTETPLSEMELQFEFRTNVPNVRNEARASVDINEKHLSEKVSTNLFENQNSDKSLEVQKNIELGSESENFSSGESESIELEEETISISSNPRAKSSILLTDRHFDKDVLDTVIKSEEDKNLFKMEINQIFDSNFKSFVFNPSAQPLDKFQECKTPKNESGFCRYVQHCFIPSVLSSIQHFMENVCVIQDRFVGVCCPEFPVSAVSVNWGNQLNLNSSSDNATEFPKDCGVGTNTRVVGGTNANRKAWPWMVALLNNNNKFFCGGSLINNLYVLTAAHCTFGPAKTQIVARLGEYDFNDPRDPHDDYRVVEVKRHGQYNRFTLRNDIALLKLEKPVVFNEFVKTICFPETQKDYIGDIASLAGWGHLNGGSGTTSDVLQEASFPVISNIQCSRTHGVSVPSSLICAAAPTHDKGACNGDSGGPLMLLDENNRWKVIGIVSWGRRKCNPEFPTVYTRVTHYMDWIRKHSV
ncbi:proclotting enzyme [Nephila pilipes]|uniref:Proclotting enzyme n=1 Tax=Nephila pilipes TaxID=299642 RepID=A0A8X6U5T0_NEPPI|nr:proclotting enzyme [Nephila pilipes]